MLRLSRRSFVGWIAGVGAALGLGARRGALARTPDAKEAEALQGAVLDGAIITRLGDVMLPSELGPDGIARVSRAFAAWIAGYRKGAEIVHPYGSPNIRYTGDSPAPRWRQQLEALERSAREQHRKAFIALPRAQREELVRAALAGERLDRMPDPLGANHVAVALASYYFGLPEAHDLCYQARIGRNQCRPLVNSPREPLPLARAGGG